MVKEFMRVGIVIVSALGCVQAFANTYTVKAGGGGDFTTIYECAKMAKPGDTCSVYAGSYIGWTHENSGTPGAPITFRAQPGEVASITSSIYVTNTQYVTFEGFRFSDRAIVGRNPPGLTTRAIVFRNNIVKWAAKNSRAPSIDLYGDELLIEGNDVSGSGSDFAILGGKNVVVRGNRLHDVDGSESNEHIDFVQVLGQGLIGGTEPTLRFSLIENNVMQTCLNDGGNCHFVLIRSGVGPIADNNIVRYNYAQNLDGSAIAFGGSQDDLVPNASAYNNTMASMNMTQEEAGWCGTVNYLLPTNGIFRNNICYNVQRAGFSPFNFIGPGANNGNLVYTNGFSGIWAAPYANEPTYAQLANQNPRFIDFPATGELQASSPAIHAGVPLTVVDPNDVGSGTTLTVADARYFQPGWAGTQGDWIRVGGAAQAQIISIDYASREITLASPIRRVSGDPVHLYKDSTGRVVFVGSAPDIGAFPFRAKSRPTAPTHLRVN